MHQSQQNNQLKERSRRFALQVVLLSRRFPRSMDGYIVGRQLVRAATATAANYRAACRTRSPAEFVSTISVVAQEADESEFWLDLSIAAEIVSQERAMALLQEAGELTAIFTASRDTAKRNIAKAQRR